MERLISLFREADYEKWSAHASSADAERVGLGDEEPIYFKQLLEYLRERREERDAVGAGRDGVSS